MENIRQEFLDQAIIELKNLSEKLDDQKFTDDLQREFFRQFHTIKGTSQTFSLNVVAKFAHELEDLLYAAQSRQINVDKEFISLLQAGTEILSAALHHIRSGKNFTYPKEFIENIQAYFPQKFNFDAENFLDGIPQEVFDKLSVQEKNSLRCALADGDFFYAFEVEFNPVNFSAEFLKLREILENTGEIIATFPKTNVSDAAQIGFRIYFASRAGEAEISKQTNSFVGNV